MKKVFPFVIVFIFLLIIFSLTSESSRIDRKANINTVKIALQNIKVDLAITGVEHSKGLSGRKSLQENEGMLFVFDIPGQYGFWMKDMNFAIDIIWLSSDKKVVYIKKDARPELFPETYKPDQDVKYVLEVVSGFAERNNLQIGDEVEFIY